MSTRRGGESSRAFVLPAGLVGSWRRGYGAARLLESAHGLAPETGAAPQVVRNALGAVESMRERGSQVGACR